MENVESFPKNLGFILMIFLFFKKTNAYGALSPGRCGGTAHKEVFLAAQLKYQTTRVD